MKRNALLIALLPFMLGMSANIIEIDWQDMDDYKCGNACVEDKINCFEGCDKWSFFQTSQALIQECFYECSLKQYYCGLICQYESKRKP